MTTPLRFSTLSALFLVGGFVLGGCAEMLEEPARALAANPGEAEVDAFWRDGAMNEALPLAQQAASEGLPWAQLRMGLFHELGEGVAQSDAKAVLWYRKAAVQFAEPDDLVLGLEIVVGLSDRQGYFRQWDDALAARFHLARHYLAGSGVPYDIERAYLIAANVLKLSENRTLEVCDMDYRTLYREVNFPQCAITQAEIHELLKNIETYLTDSERARVKQASENWEFAP